MVAALPALATMDETTVWYVDPITVKIPHNRQLPFASSTKVVDVAGQRGECERQQIWLYNSQVEMRNLVLSFSDLELEGTSESTTLPSSIWSWKQQGYVFAQNSSHYECLKHIMATPPQKPYPPTSPTCADTPQHECMTGCPADPKGECGGGLAPPGSCNLCGCNANKTACPPITWSRPCQSAWYPDPLLDVPDDGVPLIQPGFTQPLYIETCIPYGISDGNYSGNIMVSWSAGTSFQVPVKLEVWDIDLPLLNASDAFNTAFRFGSDMSKWYPNNTDPSIMWDDWFPFLAHHRVPADDIYLHAPRPTAEYQELARTGAKWMGMMDAGIWPPVPAGYVDKVLSTLAPVIQNMTDLGYLKKMYVYGFDEMPQIHNISVYEIFGAIKKKFPDVTTMAVLDWQTFPSDLPLDIWVDEYADYGVSPSYTVPTPKEQLRQNWLSSNPNHQFWWYWCIGPSNPNDMNTFIERPAIQARLLYWLTSLHAINGMLYYDVAIWSDQCPSQRPCKPCDRLNFTGLTDFNPATWNGNGHATNGGGANGDGSFTYPGPGGKPLGSLRLSNIADGIEDWQLFNNLGVTATHLSKAADLITQLVSNMTERNEDPRLMENVRRQAAHRFMSTRNQIKL